MTYKSHNTPGEATQNMYSAVIQVTAGTWVSQRQATQMYFQNGSHLYALLDDMY